VLLRDCRWEVVPPERAAEPKDWQIHLTATRDLQYGEQIILSYGASKLVDYNVFHHML
jgi:hypothetical protein